VKVIMRLAEKVVFLPSQPFLVCDECCSMRPILSNDIWQNFYTNSPSITPLRREDVSLAHASMDELVSVANSGAPLVPP